MADLEIQTDVSLHKRGSCTLDQIDMPFVQVAASQASKMKIPFIREAATPLNHIDIPFAKVVADLEIKTDVSLYERGGQPSK